MSQYYYIYTKIRQNHYEKNIKPSHTLCGSGRKNASKLSKLNEKICKNEKVCESLNFILEIQ